MNMTSISTTRTTVIAMVSAALASGTIAFLAYVSANRPDVCAWGVREPSFLCAPQKNEERFGVVASR